MTRAQFTERVGQLARQIRQENDMFGLNECKRLAIDRVRRELETQLEEDLNNPYGSGPTWSAARLTLFNSIYR